MCDIGSNLAAAAMRPTSSNSCLVTAPRVRPVNQPLKGKIASISAETTQVSESPHGRSAVIIQ